MGVMSIWQVAKERLGVRKAYASNVLRGKAGAPGHCPEVSFTGGG